MNQLIADYITARDALADVCSSIREAETALKLVKAQATISDAVKAGKNDKERDALLLIELNISDTGRSLMQHLAELERKKDALDAEIDGITKQIQSEQWNIRQEYVDLLRRRGHDADAGVMTPALDEEMDSVFSYPNGAGYNPADELPF